jgi:hypothetical protein
MIRAASRVRPSRRPGKATSGGLAAGVTGRETSDEEEHDDDARRPTHLAVRSARRRSCREPGRSLPSIGD